MNKGFEAPPRFAVFGETGVSGGKNGDSGEGNPDKYLSLKAAAEIYGYTRDHLGLMIRQNKLKGVKLGSYYVTTKEWVLEYIKNFADPTHPRFKNKPSNKFLAQALSAGGKVLPVKSAAEKKKVGSRADWQSEISKELADLAKKALSFPAVSNYAAYSDKKNLEPEPNLPLTENSNYLILPVRKMSKAERDKILKISGL